MFNVSFDIYIDRISNYTANDKYDRTGHIYLGYEDPTGVYGPCSDSSERFVMMAFYDPSNDTDGDIQLKARTQSSQDWGYTSEWANVTDAYLSYDIWYAIRVEIDVSSGVYDVYVDDVLEGDDIPKYDDYTSSSIRHISFSGYQYAKGDFYVDTVSALTTY